MIKIIELMVISYLIIGVLFAFISIKIGWLYNPYDDFDELISVGIVGILWIFIAPVFLIGYLGYLINNILD